MGVVLHAQEFDAVKVQTALHAAVQGGRLAAVHALGHGALPKVVHGQLHLFNDALVGLRALPQDLAVALDEVAVEDLEVQLPVPLPLLDLVAHGHGVLEAPQPVPRVPLLLVRLPGQVVRQDDDGQEHGVRYLCGTRYQMLDGSDNVRRRRSFNESSRNGSCKGMREHNLPATGLALFPHIGFAKYDF